MDIFLVVLCVIAFLLLFVGKREGFTGNCGTVGVPSAVNNTLRVYTPEECTSLGGRFYDDGASAGVPGYGVCSSDTGTHLADVSTDCAYLNTQPTAAPSSVVRKGATGPSPTTGSLDQIAQIGKLPPSEGRSLPSLTGASLSTVSVPPAPAVTSMNAPLPDAMPTPTGGNTLTSLPIPGMPAPQAASVMTSTPVGAPLGSGAPHGILLTIV